VNSDFAKTLHSCVVAFWVVAALAVAHQAIAQEERLVAWQQQDPWAPFTEDLRPATGQETGVVRVSACINEYASAVLLVAAPRQGEKRMLGVRVADLRSGDQTMPARQVQVRQLAFAKQAWDSHLAADPLLDRETFAVSPGKAIALWLTIHTQGVEPGDYRGTILLSDQRGARQDVGLELTVWPVALPGELPIPFHAWEDDTDSFRSNLERYVRDLAEHYVNTFSLRERAFPQLDAEGKPVKPVRDPEYVDRKLRLMAKYVRKPKVLSAFISGSTIRESADWEQTYKLWVDAVMAHLGKAGLGHDDFFVGYIDEFHGEGTQEYCKVGPALRRIAPRVKLYGGLGDATLAEEARRAAPFVDLWDLPHPDWNLPQAGEARDKMAFLKSTGKPIWDDDPYLNGASLGEPYPMLRLVPWKVWKYDLQGSDFFIYNRQVDFGFGGDVPVSVPALSGDADQAAVIYPTRDGPVGSRRWEAFREGWADYLCLCLLREEIERAKTAGAPGRLVGDAQALIREAVEKVLASPEDATLAARYKERLVREIVKVRHR